ncbi:GTPase-activating protein and VPS9 domain-containing protein 1-like [Diadema antillarum]|uniref:GTPase-activating protein and VPS9 domain-containing protein 1-like n=1 Tax=Diadema antillarum TaxID=105358 RepID=UPI003A87299F
MAVIMSNSNELLSLAQRLKEERLYVQSEKHLLQSLHEEVTQISDKLHRVAWITQQQRQTLNSLIRASSNSPPAACCYRANALERVGFIDGYKQLGFQDALYGDVVTYLRENPAIMAQILAQGEKSTIEPVPGLVQTVMSGIYGNCLVEDDEHHFLIFIQALMRYQLAESDDPRRLLRRGRCAFSVAFKLFTEALFSGKLYLTAALHEPVMAVLMNDEVFLETEAPKAMDRFTPEERKQRFGTPGTPEYEQNVQKHMNSIMEQLVGLCNEFIVGLHSNIYCFPPSLDWIISQIHKILVDSGQVSPCDVRFMCADLLLNCFIGPAIVDPEPFGITSDILVSETARFNLMQVAQILQGLALQTATSNRDSIGKAPDIYFRFPKGCMSSYLDAVIDNLSSSDTPPTTSQLKGMTRSSTFITETELHGLIGYARAVTAANPDQAIFKELEGLLASLPASQPQTSQKSSPTLGNPVTPPKPGSTPPSPSPNLSAGFKGNLASKVSNHVAKRIGKTASNASLLGQEEETSEAPSHPECVVVTQPEDVLVIALGNHSNDCPGMLSESKVLSSLPQKAKSREAAQLRVSGNLASISEMPEKHLRFSADASGNSDNMMEAMSIGASNSVYSMDLEAENVSNLSGRNTPRSAISMASSTTEHHRPEIIDSTQLPNNTNITDQFGKFDICTNLQDKKNMAPETFSETWSTDVIGSDTSEPNPNDHLQEIAEEEASLQGATAAFLDVHPVLNDPQETGSETWSVDVLQSDSEQAEDRLHEVEDAQLDMGSVMTEIESEQLLAKVSAEAGSRRSSSGESQSVDRSSSNDSPGVEDCAKRGGGLPLDTSGPKLPGMYPSDELPPIHSLPANQRLKEAGMYRQTAIPPRPTRHPPSSGIGSSFDPLGSDGSQVHSNGFTVTPEKTAKPFSPLEVNSVLQDFDPLATTPSPSANPFTASMNGNVPTVKRSNLPQGAKPKVRPAPSPMQGMPAGGGKYNDNLGSFNPLYDIHSDGYSSSPQKPDGLFDMAPSSSQFAIINHGFSDQPMNGQQNSNYLPGYSNPMASFEPPQPGGLHPSPFVPQKTQGLPFPARNSLGGSDSGVMSGESGTSSDHFSNRADSSISTASSGSASLLMVSSDSFKPLESSQMSSGEWSLLDSPASHSANFLSSPSSSTGAVVGSSEESDSKLGSTPSFDRSISSDSFETEAGLESPDKGKSWFKKKFKQINKSIARSKSQKEKSSSVREDAMWPQQVSQQGPARDIKGSSDSLQIIPNPALVSEPFDADDGVKGMSVPETSGEDILNKYRDLGKGRPVDPLEANDDSITDGINADSSVDEDSGSHGDKPDSNSTEPSSSADSDSLESTYAFNDAKRKLRIVLRSADFHNLPSLVDFTSHYRPSEGLGELQASVDGREMSRHPENELVAFLKVQLAEAMNLQDKALIAQLRETLRCVGNFDNEGCRKLLAVLREDYESRSPYVAYLVRSRKGLALSKAHLERMLERIQRDKEVVNKFFTMVCVRFFLGRQETSIIRFINDFKALTAADEKTHLVKYFLATLNSWIQQDPIWQAASDTQKQDAEVATERAIMSRIYKLALYPNGDGDILRDQVLQQHIHRLAKVVTASHKALLIPEKYRRESPWPAAQAEILNINAYKTPKDKVQCVLRCCTIIMNLLSMADSAAPPGADDFVPVLMFVLIKANPPSLLSTVQYVNSFYYESDPYSDGEGSSGSGEERYWWMQFSAAVEYLKTIDDRK